MGSIPTTTYGFVGLGQMGHGMAKNLRLKLPADSRLVVYDINQKAVSDFLQEEGGIHVQAAASPREVMDVILTSVPQASHVKTVFLHPDNGLLAVKADGRKRLFLELSTIEVAASTQVAEAVVAGGYGDFVDAPCSGGAMGAETGALSFMIGCSEPLFPRVLDICNFMGKESSIFHCGERGSGLKTKVLNNYLSSLTTLATAETINIGARSGLDIHKLNEVINASSGMSFNTKVNNPVPGLTPKNAASNGYIGGFSLELCLGVLELGYQEAQAVGAKVVLGNHMVHAYRAAAAEERYQGKDSKIIYKWLRDEDV